MEKVFAIQGKDGKGELIKKVLGLFGRKNFNPYYGLERISFENKDYCFTRSHAIPVSLADEKGIEIFDIDEFLNKYGNIVNKIPYDIGGVGIEGSLWKGDVVGLRYVDGEVKALVNVTRFEYTTIHHDLALSRKV